MTEAELKKLLDSVFDFVKGLPAVKGHAIATVVVASVQGLVDGPALDALWAYLQAQGVVPK